MSYVCVNGGIFSGHKYEKGQLMDERHILPSRAQALVRNGRIAKAEAEPAVEFVAKTGYADIDIDTIPVPIPMREQDGKATVMQLLMTPADIVATIEIMQQNVENATKAIKDVTSEEILILLDSADSRKGVKDAAKAQAEKLEKASLDVAVEKAEEQEGTPPVG